MNSRHKCGRFIATVLATKNSCWPSTRANGSFSLFYGSALLVGHTHTSSCIDLNNYQQRVLDVHVGTQINNLVYTGLAIATGYTCSKTAEVDFRFASCRVADRA